MNSVPLQKETGWNVRLQIEFPPCAIFIGGAITILLLVSLLRLNKLASSILNHRNMQNFNIVQFITFIYLYTASNIGKSPRLVTTLTAS